MTHISLGHPTSPRTEELYRAHERSILEHTDRLFAGLMFVQWLASIAAANWISPLAWSGSVSRIHVHLWAAVYLGGAISLFPIALAIVMLFLATVYLVSLRVLERGLSAHRSTLWIVLAAALVFQTTLVFLPALFSQDVFSYIAYGRLAAFYDLNPYVWPPSAIPRDAVLPWVAEVWRTYAAPYGPVWLDVQWLMARAFGSESIVYLKNADGSGSAQSFMDFGTPQQGPWDWSRDGKYLLVRKGDWPGLQATAHGEFEAVTLPADRDQFGELVLIRRRGPQ